MTCLVEGFITINPYTSIRLPSSHSKDPLLLNILKSLLYLDNMSSTPQEIYMTMKSMNIHPPSLSELCVHLEHLVLQQDCPLVFNSPFYSIDPNLIYSLPNRNIKLPRMNRSTSMDSETSSNCWGSMDEEEDCLSSMISKTSSSFMPSHSSPCKRKSPLSECTTRDLKRPRAQSLSSLHVTNEWLNFEDGDAKLSCDYICSPSMKPSLSVSLKSKGIPCANPVLDSMKLKLQCCVLDTSFPVWMTLIENVKCYISWVGETGLMHSSKQPGFPILRRLDNDMVNGTLLLHAAGLFSEQEKSIVLSLERQRIRVSNPHSALCGVWIPLSRAMSLASTHCIQDKVYPILLKDLNRLFTPLNDSTPSSMSTVSSSLAQLLSKMTGKRPPLLDRKSIPVSTTSTTTTSASSTNPTALLNALSTLIKRGSLKNSSLPLNHHHTTLSAMNLTSQDKQQGFEQDEITVIKTMRKRA